MTQTWDMIAAERADASREAPWNREKRPCYYCGTPTRAISGVCTAHSDLPKVDPLWNKPRDDLRALK